MGLRSWLVEHSSSAPSRRLFSLAALLFVGGCFASFQACSANVDPVGSSSQTQALQTSGDPAGNRGGLGRTGEYYDSTLTTTMVASSTFKRAPTAYFADGPIYAQPVIAQNVSVSGDYPKNLLIVATTKNNLYAYDADNINNLIWQKGPSTFGAPVNIGRNDTDPPEAGIGGNVLNCYNLGNIGILSTPYVDTSTSTVYVVAESLPSDLDAQDYSESDPPVFTLWALDLTTGATKSSVTLAASSNGVAFDSFKQIQRPALTPVTVGTKTFLLIGFSSSCDKPVPYFGWLMSQEITNPNSLGTGAAGSYCATCAVPYNGGGNGNVGGGIWQSGMGFAVDNQNNVYFQNGNGVGYEAGNPGALSNTVFKLQVASDGSMTVSDFFTPSNQAYLTAHDLDLGVSGVSWLGGNDGGGPNVLLSGSKEGKVYLVDPGNLGQYGASDNVLGELQGSCGQFDPGCGSHGGGTYDPVNQPANCQGNVLQPDSPGYDDGGNGGCNDIQDDANWPHIHGAPVFWAEQNYIYFMGQYDYLRRLKLNPSSRTFDTTSGDSFAFADAGQIAPSLGFGGLVSLSYNASAPSGQGGVLWVNTRLPKEDGDWYANTNLGYTNTHAGAELAPGAFYAVDATQMTKLFADAPVTKPNSYLISKFTTPTVFNGRVYQATMSNEVLVYCNDQDGDGICDTMDNCPTVANADQANSNYDAERILGSVPILGDACDPNATTSLLPLPPNGTNGDTTSDGVSVPCTEILLACSSTSNGGSATCTRRFNTKLTFNAHIGNDAGTAPGAPGTSAPAFCKVHCREPISVSDPDRRLRRCT